MNETYVEVLVKRKTPAYMGFLKVLSIMLTVCFCVIGTMGFFPALMIGVVIGIAAYFIYMNAEVEYEYLYMDRELVVDKIMAKSKRKRIETFDMNKVEIMAPVNSYRLDYYKNRACETTDYSTGEQKQPDTRYVFYYDGKKKVIFEPDQRMVKAIQNIAPHKVFKD